MRLRKDVSAYIYDPSKKLFQVVVELRNTPGALHDLLGLLRDLNLNVLTSFSSVDTEAKSGVWSGFVEGSRFNASELKRKISSSSYVLDSIIKESRGGFLVDTVHFPVALNSGERAVLMRSKYLRSMLSAIKNEFGAGGEVIIFEEGFAYGKEGWADTIAALGVEFVRSNLPNVLNLYPAMGWLKIDEIDQSGQDGTVRILTSGSFECEGVKSDSPCSHFVRGHLAGALTSISGEDFACEETKCIATGDLHCEFVLRPKAGSGRPAWPNQSKNPSG